MPLAETRTYIFRMKAAQITVMLLAVSIVGSYAAGRPLKEVSRLSLS